MNEKQLNEKINQASHKYIPRNLEFTGEKFVQDAHRPQRHLTLVDSQDPDRFIYRIKFGVDRNYIEQLASDVYKTMNSRIAPIFVRGNGKRSLDFLNEEVRNKLIVTIKKEQVTDNQARTTTTVSEPVYTNTKLFNIIIPIFNLSNKITNAFSEWTDIHTGFNQKQSQSCDLLCNHFIKDIQKAYSNPKNLIKLCKNANFIYPVSIVPIPLKSNMAKLAPKAIPTNRANHIAKEINPYLDLRSKEDKESK